MIVHNVLHCLDKEQQTAFLDFLSALAEKLPNEDEEKIDLLVTISICKNRLEENMSTE